MIIPNIWENKKCFKPPTRYHHIIDHVFWWWSHHEIFQSCMAIRPTVDGKWWEESWWFPSDPSSAPGGPVNFHHLRPQEKKQVKHGRSQTPVAKRGQKYRTEIRLISSFFLFCFDVTPFCWSPSLHKARTFQISVGHLPLPSISHPVSSLFWIGGASNWSNCFIMESRTDWWDIPGDKWLKNHLHSGRPNNKPMIWRR